MKLLLDEMYPEALAAALRDAGLTATTVAQSGLAGRSDAEVFAAAVTSGLVLLTENVGDFTRIAADHASSGGHHPGLIVALSSRFSRRPAGRRALVTAICAAAGDRSVDRVVFLDRVDTA